MQGREKKNQIKRGKLINEKKGGINFFFFILTIFINANNCMYSFVLYVILKIYFICMCSVGVYVLFMFKIKKIIKKHYKT